MERIEEEQQLAKLEAVQEQANKEYEKRRLAKLEAVQEQANKEYEKRRVTKMRKFETEDFNQGLEHFPDWYSGVNIGGLYETLSPPKPRNNNYYKDEDDEFRTKKEIAQRKEEHEERKEEHEESERAKLFNEFSLEGKSLSSDFIAVFDWKGSFDPETKSFRGSIPQEKIDRIDELRSELGYTHDDRSSNKYADRYISFEYVNEPPKISYSCSVDEAKKLVRGEGMRVAILFALVSPYTRKSHKVSDLGRQYLDGRTGHLIVEFKHFVLFDKSTSRLLKTSWK